MLSTITKEVRYIPEHSIVRLPDGRVGFLGKNGGGKPRVRVELDSIVEVVPHAALELLSYPAALVQDRPERHWHTIAFLNERAACGSWPIPDTPAEIAAWALDEMTVQSELAHKYPGEAVDRMASAARFAELAATYLQNGTVPAALPWEENYV